MIDQKYITVNGKQLSEILISHKKWVLDQEGGQRADLRWADLRWADLRGADLRGADLQGADLQGADLQGADLRRADLRRADLRRADLRWADLQGADLRWAENADFAVALVTITPEGDIIGWKKLADGLIAKLLIPANAKRSNATGRKCRAEFAKVLEIWDGELSVKTGRSDYDNSFIYKVGKIAKPTEPFDENRWEECSTGIHFFITRVEAENHN